MNQQDKYLVLERYVRGKEDELIEAYVLDGPMALKMQKGFSEDEWEIVFNYLVFDKGLVFKCIMQNLDFFIEEYVKHGMAHIREIFEIQAPKYDNVAKHIFDFIAIANDALYQHVLHHRDRYMLAMKARGSDFVRKILGVWGDKYNESWEKLLNTLLHAVCDAIFTENTYERGLDTFCKIMNGMREHRALVKHDMSKHLR